jgi:hypothetical protein
VSRVSNIKYSVLAAPQWRARLGASVLLSEAAATQRGTAVSGVVGVSAVTPMAVQLGQPTSNQTHNYKYATGIDANGVGASGPPRRRETA